MKLLGTSKLLAKKLRDLSRAEESGLYITNPSLICKLRDEIQVLKIKEETMWKQRAHSEWLMASDSNTRYFHCRANQRNKHNYIMGFKDNLGQWVDDEGWIGVWWNPISMIFSPPPILLVLMKSCMV